MAEERRVGMGELLRGIKRIEAYTVAHSGEGQDTTHALIEKRLDSTDKSITRFKTIGTVVSGLVLAAWGLFKSKLLGKI